MNEPKKLPPHAVPILESMADRGEFVASDMRAAYKTTTGRDLPSAEILPSSHSYIEDNGIDVAVSFKTPKTKSNQFSRVLDVELDALARVTDGTDAAGGVAVIVGLRRALREAFKSGRSAKPYGPAGLLRSDIARAAMCSVKTVSRWLATLEGAGVVEIQRIKKASGENHPSIYRMLLDDGGSGHNDPTGGDTMTRGVGTRPQNSLSPTSEETQKETKKETEGDRPLPFPLELSIQDTEIAAKRFGVCESRVPELWTQWRRRKKIFKDPIEGSVLDAFIAETIGINPGKESLRQIKDSRVGVNIRIPEPTGWQAWIDENAPMSDYGPGQRKHGCKWEQVEPYLQKFILEKLVTPNASSS